jgi:Leucine-rich repeat (LRR) protein
MPDFYISNNKIRNISMLYKLNNLICLILNKNKIVDISILKNFPNLRKLDLEFNDIKDISMLKCLKNSLNCLNLGNNKIVDISVFKDLNEGLCELNLQNNLFNGLGVLNYLPRSLKILYLHGNNITWDEVNIMIRLNYNLSKLSFYHSLDIHIELNNPNRKMNATLIEMLSLRRRMIKSSLRKFNQSRDIFGLIHDMLYI